MDFFCKSAFLYQTVAALFECDLIDEEIAWRLVWVITFDAIAQDMAANTAIH